MPLTIEVPKIRWRIQGLHEQHLGNWLASLEEIWIGDWRDAKELRLIVSTPQHISGYARLTLGGTQHSYDAVIKSGMVNFNLLPFNDTLVRGPTLQQFKLSLVDSIKKELLVDIIILRVRTKWEVKNVKMIQKEQDGKFTLMLVWDEYGKMSNRVIRFWSIYRPWEGLVTEITVPDDLHEIQIDETAVDMMTPGLYLAEFSVDDPWAGSQTTPSFPEKDCNIALMKITGDQSFISEWNITWISEATAEVSGNVKGVESGISVETTLYGRMKGEWVAWKGDSVLAENGYFKVKIKAERNAVHWIGIKARDKTDAYIFAVLPDPKPLEFSLFDNNFISLQFTGSPCFRVDLRDVEGSRGNLSLSITTSWQVLKAVREGQSEVRFKLVWEDGTKKEAKLEIDAGNKVNTLSLERGTLCTTCGKLLPDLAAWYRHTSFSYSPTCKSLIPNFEKTKARLVLVWDIKPFLGKVLSNFPLIGPPILSTNSNNPLEYQDTICMDELSHLIPMLLHREFAWVQQINQTGLVKKG